jgi:hypothetical protein
MAASHFFVGLAAGAALLTVPVLALSPGIDLPHRLVAWIDGPPAPSSTTNVAAVSRPIRGYVPGAPGTTGNDQPSVDDGTPPPTLAPAARPTVAPARPAVAVAPPSNSLRTGVIRGGGQPVVVRRAPGAESADDPQLADGSPVLVSGGSDTQVGDQHWRGVRGLNGIVGWVPAYQVVVDGETPVQPPPAVATLAPTVIAERLRVANTGGVGVVLRGSPNDADRRPVGLAEGATVAVVERGGANSAWVHVRTDAGQDGWVPARYLAPAA